MKLKFICLIMMCWIISRLPGFGQQIQLSATVLDASGRGIAGARITADGMLVATAQENGTFSASMASGAVLQVRAEGFLPLRVNVSQIIDGRILLRVAPAQRSIEETVQVTAYRVPLAEAVSPASVRVLSMGELETAPLPTLDSQLRRLPGIETFRRSSSLVANPTSQGLSLRGLGSTASSRTLLIANDVPLNDAFGGWIHWEEQPELSIRQVEVVRGGASDLYGSSAIGGVVNLLPVHPDSNRVSLLTSYGGLDTHDDALLLSGKRGIWAAQGTGGLLRTDGYTLIAPVRRGTVDVPSNVHAQNGLVDFVRDQRQLENTGLYLFLHGSVFNEARGNGTPIQANGTRIWRYSSGADWTFASGGQLTGRLFGSTGHYRQSFSSIPANRNTEALTRTLKTPDDEMGAVGRWSQPVRTDLVVLAGADVRDVRAQDTEISYRKNLPTGVFDATARQRQTGVYGEAIWTPQSSTPHSSNSHSFNSHSFNSHSWTLSGAGRIDHFTNFDARETQSGTPVPVPSLSETVFDPRLGVARRITSYLSLTANGFRAYRAPTEYELYRTGQVGQEVTLANPALRSERATGWEAGSVVALKGTTVRSSYFWTQVNRPITAVTTKTTATQITKLRENLGQITSRGVAIDFESRPVNWAMVTGGYQYADATVTNTAAANAQLLGKWIPQVARNMATLQTTFTARKLTIFSLQGRVSGRQYDDDANQFLLHGYFRLDATVAHSFASGPQSLRFWRSGTRAPRFEVFASAENLFDRSIEVGRTPNLTLGTPLVGRIGLRVKTGD